MLAQAAAAPARFLTPSCTIGAMTLVDCYATVNGLRIHYLEWGREGKQPLLLLHGIARVAHTFDHVAPHFMRNYRGRGSGASPRDLRPPRQPDGEGGKRLELGG